ncbi:hypothetical protein EBH_0082330 [Eimeria brunetti]|uniref:Uncharacterized protein n=1 Tax=Eimeria brunetti TaxID=51314 RepID=U6LKS6_9EIME|nr:hypothetical protein EBH_0082330 [Eimeria brunetti]
MYSNIGDWAFMFDGMLSQEDGNSERGGDGWQRGQFVLCRFFWPAAVARLDARCILSLNSVNMNRRLFAIRNVAIVVGRLTKNASTKTLDAASCIGLHLVLE